MNEGLLLAPALAAGLLLGGFFSSVASGGRLLKAFRLSARRCGSLAACCFGRALPWRDFILSGARIGSGGCRVSLVLFWLASP